MLSLLIILILLLVIFACYFGFYIGSMYLFSFLIFREWDKKERLRNSIYLGSCVAIGSIFAPTVTKLLTGG